MSSMGGYPIRNRSRPGVLVNGQKRLVRDEALRFDGSSGSLDTAGWQNGETVAVTGQGRGIYPGETHRARAGACLGTRGKSQAFSR